MWGKQTYWFELWCITNHAKVNTITKPIVIVVTCAKSTSTCTNCDKTSHILDTCYIQKKKVPVVQIATIKSTKQVVGTKTHVKLVRIHVR